MRFEFKILTVAIPVIAAVGIFKSANRHETTPAETSATNLSAHKIVSLATGSLSETQIAPTNSSAENYLFSLCDAKKFQSAVALAQNAPEEFRESRLELVFARWTQSDPHEAMNALAEIHDESLRDKIFQTIADVWSAENSTTLADYAVSLPDGNDRDYALAKAMDNWSLQDPAALAAWLNAAPAGVDLNLAIAEMISKTDGANRPPEIAALWVENISDDALKYNSLVHVLMQWNESDSAAAQNYLNSISWLDENQKLQILAKMKTPPVLAGGDE